MGQGLPQCSYAVQPLSFAQHPLGSSLNHSAAEVEAELAFAGTPSVACEPDLAMVTGTLSLAWQAEWAVLTGMPPVTLCLERQLASPRQLHQSDQLLLHLCLPYWRQLCLCLQCSCMQRLKPEATLTHLPHPLPTLVAAHIPLYGNPPPHPLPTSVTALIPLYGNPPLCSRTQA